MSDVWVICVAYDYGVVSSAGWFQSEVAAQEWIEAEHSRRRAEWNVDGVDDYDQYKSGYYAVQLAAHPERKGQ